MLSLILSAAQAAGAESWLESLGSFLPFGALTLLALGFMGRLVQRLMAELEASHQREREMADRLIAQNREVLPVMSDAVAALGEAARELNRRDR